MSRIFARSLVGPRVVGAASIVVVFALVELAIRSNVINGLIVPRPSAVLLNFGRLYGREHLLTATLWTFCEVLVAGFFVTIIGVPVGVVLHRIRLLGNAFETWIAAFAAAPITLAYPIFLVIFGRNSAAIIVFAVIAGLPPVILKTREGLARIRPVFLDVSKALQLSGADQFFRIELPAAMATIFTGIRLGLIVTLIAVIALEYLVGISGLGLLVGDLADRYDLAGTYGTIAFVILVSAGMFALLEAIERRLKGRL